MTKKNNPVPGLGLGKTGLGKTGPGKTGPGKTGPATARNSALCARPGPGRDKRRAPGLPAGSEARHGF